MSKNSIIPFLKAVSYTHLNPREALVEYMESLHTEYAEEVGLKYAMERGDSIKETGAVHRTTEELSLIHICLFFPSYTHFIYTNHSE